MYLPEKNKGGGSVFSRRECICEDRILIKRETHQMAA